ncbi:MurR/RpiR family transcriptional regulator [Ligilactobacillus murinus]|uniref:MurR/RpiR family transcriptional regulator n=1 Tax=Ligilactobacillus murinus TaxID=1622 RepID=UPI00096E0C67|nr:MurR/RpiR family transcriptional regulator [Ligilactobacillus murinus]
MDTLLVIRQNYSNFTPVEKKIADYIFEVEEQILGKSAQEVAKDLGTSTAALVRFSRKLGYAGFSQLKQKLSASYAFHADDKKYYEEVSDAETPRSLKNKLKVRINHMVETTNDALADEAVEKAVAMIKNKDLLFVFGIGASAIVAQDIFQKFSRIGKKVFFLQDTHLFVSALAVHQNDALFMAVSMKGETKEVIDIAKLAQEMTIPLIVISGREDSTLAKLADCLLHSVSGEDYKMRTAATMSLMAQLYVVDVLFYMYVSKHFAQSYQKLQQTKDIIKKLEQ